MTFLDNPGSRLTPRSRLVERLLQQGTSGAPVQSFTQGLDRLGKVLVGSLLQRREERNEGAATQALLSGFQGGPLAGPTGEPGTAPGGLEGAIAATGALKDNPFASRLARRLTIAQAERDAARGDAEAASERVLRNALEVAGFKAENRPPKFGSEVPLPDEVAAQRIDIAQAGRPLNVGSIPPGFRLTSEGEMVRIPGSPAAIEAEQREEKVEKTRESKQRAAAIVVEDIDRVLEKVNDANFLFPVTGFGAGLQSQIAGTPATDTAALLNTIKANVGFDRLNEMRQNSPTGGALGQVSENENRLLQSVLGNVEQSQSEEQLRFNLERLREVFLDTIHGSGNRPEEEPAGLPGTQEELQKMSDDEVLKALGIR